MGLTKEKTSKKEKLNVHSFFIAVGKVNTSFNKFIRIKI